MWSVRFEIQMIEMTNTGPHPELAISDPYTTAWQISKMWLAKASSIKAKFEIRTCKNYASYVIYEISLPCSLNRKQLGFFGVFGINTDSSYFKTPQISLAAAAARDILVNFEISLAVSIPNTPNNRAISYTNCPIWPVRLQTFLIWQAKRDS